MKIVSINSSLPVTIEFNNEEVLTGIYKTPMAGPVQITPLGIAEDTIVNRKVHGGPDQAIYIYHQEDYDWWSNQLGATIAPGAFGENLTLSGIENIAWVIGDRIKFNKVELEITAPRTPCFKLGVRMGDKQFVKKFVRACRPGAYARVIKEGAVSTGESFTVNHTSENYATVVEVFNEWHSKEKSLPLLEKALQSPIASMHKGKIQEWYDALS